MRRMRAPHTTFSLAASSFLLVVLTACGSTTSATPASSDVAETAPESAASAAASTTASAAQASSASSPASATAPAAPAGPAVTDTPKGLVSVTHDAKEWGAVPHRVLDQCGVSDKADFGFLNYGKFELSKDDLKAVLDKLDGICTDRDREHKELLACADSKKSPFVYVSFKLPTPPKDPKALTKCDFWIKTAELKGRKWIVVDNRLGDADGLGANQRHEYVFEPGSGAPTLYFENWDAGGPQMMTCQAPGAVDELKKSKQIPSDLSNFFLCDSWQ